MIRIIKIDQIHGEPFYAAQQPRFLRSPLYLCTQDETDRDIVKFQDPGSLLQELTENYIRNPQEWIPLSLQDYGYQLVPSVAFVLKSA